MGKKVAIFVDIRKVHEKWSIFCFYDSLWIIVVFEIIAFEVDDFWNFVYYNENMNAVKIRSWINKSCVFCFTVFVSRLKTKIFKFSRQYTTFIDSGMNFRHRQERDETIVQTTHERDDKNGTTIVLVISFIVSLFVYCVHCVHVFVVIHQLFE